MVATSPVDATPAPGAIRTVRGVHHAVALLRALRDSSGPLPLSKLARRVGLSTSSTLHLMRTLEAESFVLRDETGGYSLSWGLYELGMVVAQSQDITKVARFHLDELAELTGEAVLLGIREGNTVLYLDHGQSNHSWFAMTATAGRRSPLHTNASGKLILAFMPSDEVEEILGATLEAHTAATIVDPRKLRSSLRDIRRQGYATCWQEQEIGLNSISVPIYDVRNQLCAALTIAGPSARLTRSSLRRLMPLLFETASRITLRMGGRPPDAVVPTPTA